MENRHLDWEGCFNTRDLGGLPTIDGRRTRWGAVVRSDAVDRLTARGWEALVGHGVRTVIDLRNEEERKGDVSVRPSVVETIELPLDNAGDRRFWDEWDSGPQYGTPLYYHPHLVQFPAFSARVVAAIAGAKDGAVLFHCQGGRDRAGQITMLVLRLAGVPPDVIADDYELSHARLRVAYAARGEEDQGEALVGYLAEIGTSAREVIVATLRDLDVETHLGAAGLGAADVARLRARLVEVA